MSFISTRKGIIYSVLLLVLLSACGRGRTVPEVTPARVSRPVAGPCSGSFLYSEDRTQIEGILVDSSVLPFSLKIGPNRRTPPALRDVTEVLRVLDTWHVERCKEGLEISPSERAGHEEETERIARHLRAFVLVVTLPYGSEEEANQEIKNWIDGVRTQLLRGFQRRSP